jgi:hypothetical protein
MTQIELHKSNLTPVQQELVRSANKKTIATRANEDKMQLQHDLRLALNKIMRKVGIRIAAPGSENEKYQTLQIIDGIDILMRHYYNFTISEILSAFDFMLAGRLNKYIRQRDNRAPVDHYQSFDITYITRVLNAFKEYKSDAIKLINPEYLPASKQLKESTITTMSPESLERLTWELIEHEFEKYKRDGRFRFYIPSETLKFLKSKGARIEVEPVTDKDIAKSMAALLTIGYMEPHTKKDIETKKEKSSRVILDSENNKINKAIRDFFDQLIKENKTIKDFKDEKKIQD